MNGCMALFFNIYFSYFILLVIVNMCEFNANVLICSVLGSVLKK